MSDFLRATHVIATALYFACSVAAASADELRVRDPTRPPSSMGNGWVPKEQDGSLRLVSTAVSEGSRSAVINDEVVTIGSLIGGAVVTAIEQGRVTLKRGSEDIVLHLFTSSVKRPARDSS